MAQSTKLTMYGANIGAQVSPPSGGNSSSSTAIFHHELKVEDVALPADTETEVIALPSFTPAAGSTVQLSGVLCYQQDGNSLSATQLEIKLKSNGDEILDFTTILTGLGSGEPTAYAFAAAIPVTAFEVGDGAARVYSVTITTDGSSDGEQTVVTAELIANVLAA